MKTKRPKRNYIMPDSAMAKTGDDLIASAVRDLVLLAPFGYNEARLESIRVEIMAFKNLYSDNYFIGRKMVATLELKKAVANMGRSARGVLLRASAKYEKNQAMIDSFGLKGYSKLRASEKIAACQDTLGQGITMLDELAAEGLTLAILNDLKDKIAMAKDAIANQRRRVGARNMATSTRIEMGNNLYNTLVILANTGKGIHADTNEAKYNDYLIYEGRKKKQIKTKKKKALN